MSQMQTGGHRRTAKAGLDVYTAMALAGTFSLIVACLVLWIKGAEMADAGMPFNILQ